MKKTLWQNSAFIIPYILFLLIAGIFLFLNSKGEAHLILNQYRFTFFDYFFFCATYAGDGIAVVALTLLLCFVKYRYAILVAASNSIAALLTQTLKHTLFADVVRPKKFFEGIAELNVVPYVENYLYNSFPSGHTTAAFATFFCGALLIENKWLKFLMFLIAVTIGFSRVYLSQHFLSDVYAGSLIGVITSLLMYQFVFISERTKNISWMEKSITVRSSGARSSEYGEK